MIQLTNISVQEFERMLDSGTEMVSIGAGQALRNLCEKYEKLTECLCYAADNYKTGIVDLDGCRIPVRRLDQCEKSEDRVFLVASMQYAVDFMEQMDQMERFDGAKVYVPAIFTDEAADSVPESDLFRPNAKQLIPKTIHYCWFGGKELPEQFQRNIETWKRYCPDYEIIRWDESNYDVSKNLYMKQAYERQYWGFVSDYARLDIVNACGGVYLDTDVELLKPLDDLLQFKLYCGFENKDYINFGLGFGSVKDNLILHAIMEQYGKMMFINPDESLNLIPCPQYQTDVLETYGLIKNGQTQIMRDFTALSPKYLNPVNMNGVGQPTPLSFSIHQYAATWYTDKQRSVKAKKARAYQYLYERMQ